MIIRLFTSGREQSRRGEFLASTVALGSTVTSRPGPGPGAGSIDQMVGRETGQGRFDHMSLLMFPGVLVDDPIGTTSGHRSRQNAFPLITGPFTGIFTDTESFDGTRSESCLGSLGEFLLAPTSGVVAFAAGGAGGGGRVGVVVTTARTAAMVVFVSTGAVTVVAMAGFTAIVIVVVAVAIVVAVVVTVRTSGTFLHGGYTGVSGVASITMAMAVTTVATVVVRIVVVVKRVIAATARNDIHRAVVVGVVVGMAGVAIRGRLVVTTVAVVVSHFYFTFR